MSYLKGRYDLNDEELLLLGAGFAIKEDWGTIDNKIVPEFEERLSVERVQLIRGGQHLELVERINQFLNSGEGKVADYGATLALSLFKIHPDTEPQAIDYNSLANTLYNFLNYPVSPGESMYWARFRATMALLEADSSHVLSQTNVQLDAVAYGMAAKILSDGVKRDPSLDHKAKGYIKLAREILLASLANNHFK